MLFKINQKDEDEENDANSQAQRDRKVMNDNLFGGDVNNRRVMQFGQKAPTSLVNYKTGTLSDNFTTIY
jgi:hypothetical protein